jgi:hypothetical protein
VGSIPVEAVEAAVVARGQRARASGRGVGRSVVWTRVAGCLVHFGGCELIRSDQKWEKPNAECRQAGRHKDELGEQSCSSL